MQATDTPNPEEHNSFGIIKIRDTVVASIVRLATLDVKGVCGVGHGFVDHLGGIGEMFSRRESDRGVKVQEDGEDNYEIEVRVLMAYGTDLARTAQNVQSAIRHQVHNMTGKHVVKVDVVIDGVRMREEKRAEGQRTE